MLNRLLLARFVTSVFRRPTMHRQSHFFVPESSHHLRKITSSTIGSDPREVSEDAIESQFELRFMIKASARSEPPIFIPVPRIWFRIVSSPRNVIVDRHF